MKKLLSVLPSTLQGGFRGGLLFLALLVTTTLWAYDFQSGDLYYNITSSSAPYTVKVTSKSSSYPYNNGVTFTSAAIPETVTYSGTTYSVTSIGDRAFSGCSALTSIVIPESVTSIGDGAFSGCSSLTKTNYIGDIAGWCNIKFGGGSANPMYYSHNFYINDQEIKDLVIPNTVDTIHNYAFYNCSSLTSVTIPESITSIRYNAFYSCSGLTSIIVEGGNAIYDSRENCNAIVETTTNTLIVGCQSTVIPNSVTSIEYGAFCNCSSLTSIIIPNSVTSIGYDAFSGTSIAYITIPESVTSIGSSFHGCSSLTTVVWNAHNAHVAANDGPFRDCPIASFTFGEKVKHIPYQLCSGLTLLTSITIPNSVTSIEYAFDECCFTKDNFINNSSLDAEANNYWGAKVVDLEIDGLLIRNDTVIYCRPYVTAAVIPNSVTSIGDYAFRNCKSLTSVTIPNSVTSIGYGAFSNCSSLTSITIPNSVTSIGDEAFSGCSSLPIENNLRYADTYLVRAVDKTLSTYSIKKGTKWIGSSAFSFCSALTSITIPNSVTSIGDNAFAYCDSLTSITIPNSVTSIEDYVFADCSSLASITIPESVTSIGYRAFSGCSALTSITCEATTPPTLGSDVFYQVSTSIPVYVPCGCVSAYKAASTWKDFTKIQEPQAEYSIQVSTSNSQMGTAKVDYNTYCDGSQISATANYGYHFVQWSDGVTDNPRTITLTQDTVLTAEFALTTAGQCGKNLYWVYDTNKSTLTITGSGDMYNERPWGLFANDLTEVALPEGLTHIGNDAFTNCNNLKAITIPASVTSIGANSFAGCRNLRNVNCYPLLPPYAETTSFANYNVNLNVPCDYLEDYQYDIVFGSFKYIQCISSDEVEDTDDVEIDAGTTDVTIIWPTEEDADTYSIVIYKDGRVFCTLTFNANGQLLNIAFAPGRDGNRPAQYAEQVANGYRFTVTGLTESTKYEYNITTKDESDNTISTHTGEFTTKSNTPTDLENTDIQYPISDTRKLLRDNQLYILHNGKMYNVMGAEIQ